MTAERILDVSALPAPEPLERTLEALDTLAPGQYLRVYLPREPVHLFPLLRQAGYAWVSRPGLAAPWEILIWDEQDPVAMQAARAGADRP